MKKRKRNELFIALALVIAFVVWTLLVRFIDVGAIGPCGSSVGFSTLNGFVHSMTGANMTLYVVTDWLGLVPIAVALGFAILGLIQLISRRSLFKVDHSILALGAFYVVVIAAYLLFECVVINYRPVLISGYLEASYPSSTTMLVTSVMPTALMQLNSRIKSTAVRRCVGVLIVGFTAFMVIGRLISGVHWFTDIIGGLILSAGLVTAYHAISGIK